MIKGEVIIYQAMKLGIYGRKPLHLSPFSVKQTHPKSCNVRIFSFFFFLFDDDDDDDDVRHSAYLVPL